jgi:hypothetical protein
MNDVTQTLKDRAVFLGWIAGLVLVAALFWILSFPVRSVCLMQSTNKVLTAMDDPRRLAAPLLRPIAGPDPLGCWYHLADSDSLFFVFTIMRDGILVPCGAEIAASGELVGIVPLGTHARQVMGQIPQGLIQVYVRRIETAAATLNAAAIAAAPRRGKR